MLRMRKEVQKSSASRPLARSGHRHCCRPSRWCQSWFLLVVSFRSRRPCPWSSVSFLEISRTRRLCASGKVGKRSQQAKRYVQLFGFRNGGFVFSAFKIDHQANRLLGNKGLGEYEIPTKNRRQKVYKQSHATNLPRPSFPELPPNSCCDGIVG